MSIKNIQAVELMDEDLEQVAGGMGVESQFAEVDKVTCKCLKCGAVIESATASIHAKTCRGKQNTRAMA